MSIIAFGEVIVLMSAVRLKLKLHAACASIIAFGVVICMMRAVWRQHVTLVRRMREYYCLWRGFLHDDCSRA